MVEFFEIPYLAELEDAWFQRWRAYFEEHVHQTGRNLDVTAFARAYAQAGNPMLKPFDCLFIKMSPDAHKPEKGRIGDAGYDLFVSRDIVIPPRGFCDVHTDIAAFLPMGCWARLTGRSSTIRKHGLLVNEGVIDNQYTGELFIGVFNLVDTMVQVRKGDRIAQIIFQQLIVPDWREVNELPATARGAQGFGSTGR